MVPRVGFPDPDTFAASYALLADFHDELWQRTGIGPERTVLGGFSMGCVMSYALALGADRPAPAGILAFSGFIPSVEGWQAHFEDRRALRAFVRHGTEDPVIEIAFGRAARETLRRRRPRRGLRGVLRRSLDPGGRPSRRSAVARRAHSVSSRTIAAIPTSTISARSASGGRRRP